MEVSSILKNKGMRTCLVEHSTSRESADIVGASLNNRACFPNQRGLWKLLSHVLTDYVEDN
jgi:hypothetical protein